MSTQHVFLIISQLLFSPSDLNYGTEMPWINNRRGSHINTYSELSEEEALRKGFLICPQSEQDLIDNYGFKEDESGNLNAPAQAQISSNPQYLYPRQQLQQHTLYRHSHQQQTLQQGYPAFNPPCDTKNQS